MGTTPTGSEAPNLWNLHPFEAQVVAPGGNGRGSVIAWSLCSLAVLIAISSGAMVIINRSDLATLTFLVIVLASTVVGGLVAASLPGNPVGWLFLGSGLSFGLSVLTHEYAIYGLKTNAGSLPWAEYMVWPQSWLWVPGAVPIMILVPLYFPNGRLISRRWRPIVIGTGIFSIVGAAFSAVDPGEVQGSGFNNPLGIERLAQFLQFSGGAVVIVWFALLFSAAASLVVRYRTADVEQRHQIKWLAFSASLVPLWFLVSPSVEAVAPGLFLALDSLAIAGIPISVGFAMLRYRLFEIDRIINRTLVYGTLTACILGIYMLLVAYTQALFDTRDNALVAIVATGVVATLFAPIRARLQQGVNRLMYGERDDPYTVISRLGQQLKASTAPGTVLQIIVDTVARSLKVPYAAIWLDRGGAPEMAAAFGTSTQAAPIGIPLTYGADRIGELVISPRAPGEPFDQADMSLLEDLARHAEAAAYAMLLTADLQRSRERLVTAREEERRRLRRDLHDGLGPQLASLKLRVESARYALSGEYPELDSALNEIATQTQATIGDIRRVVNDLRPPALDQFGLVWALKEYAASCSQSGLHVSVTATGLSSVLPAAVEVAAYRIVQETVANVLRHARAANCTVSLDGSSGDHLVVRVMDDGVGISPDHRAGVGLVSMAERAAELGGTCSVQQMGQTGGTEVLVTLPLLHEGATT